MRDANSARAGRAAAVFYGSLFCAAALTAVADYDSADMSGNLQDQCKEFSAAVVRDTSFTVSAVCNHEGGGTSSTSFDLSGDVSWDTSEQKLAWDATLAGYVQDIAAKCKPKKRRSLHGQRQRRDVGLDLLHPDSRRFRDPEPVAGAERRAHSDGGRHADTPIAGFVLSRMGRRIGLRPVDPISQGAIGAVAPLRG